MTAIMKLWREALKQASRQEPYTDRQKRSCKELKDHKITIQGLNDLEEPLRAIRDLGWYYPPSDELSSIILGKDTQHIYTFSSNIAQQLPRIIRLLEEDPHSRRALLHLTDQPMDVDEEHLPCLISAHFTIDDDKLNCTVHARSMDLLVGFPANIYQAGTLARHVAERLGKKECSLTLFINSAHVFDDYEEKMSAILHNA